MSVNGEADEAERRPAPDRKIMGAMLDRTGAGERRTGQAGEWHSAGPQQPIKANDDES
jgi:hypothetical protein